MKERENPPLQLERLSNKKTNLRFEFIKRFISSFFFFNIRVCFFGKVIKLKFCLFVIEVGKN
jgi:hypothetical protein